MSRKQVREYLSLARFQWENHRALMLVASRNRAMGRPEDDGLADSIALFLWYAQRYEAMAAEFVAALPPKEARPYLEHRLAAIRLAAFQAVT